MPTLVVKSLPEPLHTRLREQAHRNHRSITKEAIVILERGLMGRSTASIGSGRRPLSSPLPPPLKLKGGPLTTEQIRAAIDDGRE